MNMWALLLDLRFRFIPDYLVVVLIVNLPWQQLPKQHGHALGQFVSGAEVERGLAFIILLPTVSTSRQ